MRIKEKQTKTELLYYHVNATDIYTKQINLYQVIRRMYAHK